MKKTWFLAVLCALLGTNVFAGSCPSYTTEYEGTQEPEDDEFLYPTVDDWKTANNTYNGLEGESQSDSVDATIYECDNDFCTDGQRVLLENNHYFEGVEQSGPTMYTCHITNFDDYWTSYKLEECDDFSDNWEKLEFANTPYHECYKATEKDGAYLYISYCCLSEGAKACFAAKKRGEPANWNGTSCNCGDVHIWDSEQEKCIPNAPNKDKPDPVINPPADKKTCREQRTTTEGKACCDLPKEVAEWTGKECRCLVSGMKFVERKGRGYCEATQSDKTKPFECNTDTLGLIANWSTQCKNNADIMALIDKIQEMCRANTKSEQEFNKLWGALLELQPQNCTQTSNTDVTITITKLTERVNNAYIQLTSIHNKFRDDVSVWKNEDGNFNTARLASDSIAGVVLGTAGGLITSSVVKKNQVENGFEDIKCTIGGQNVAEWGDQFRVGIQ